MAKDKKAPRPKAATPKGFRDYFGAEVSDRKAMLDTIAGVYHRYGFDALESSAVETVEALGKFLPDVDRPNAGVFAWQEADDGDKGDWLALRYDLTAPLARVYAQHRNDLPTPYRRYAMGPVWRNEKPGPGRFRQFYQCDADTVGSASMAADAEICAMLADTLEAVGIERGDYVVRVNNRKVLNGVLEAIGAIGKLPDGKPDMNKLVTLQELDTATMDAVLRTIDKFDKVGKEGVRKLLTTGRKDSSGAFIEGVGLHSDQAETVVAFLTAKGATNRETIRNLSAAVPHDGEGIGAQGIGELQEIFEHLEAQDYREDRIVIDPSVVRGLGYYTGPVYEAELTFEILDEKGRKRQFGSVAGGGRYDDLVKRFTGQAAGIRAEVYLGNPKNFGNQLKYADKRASPVAIIEGTEEHERGVIQIKDLILGAKIAENATLEEWKERPSQFEVPRDQLVAKTLEIIESHA